jgi:CheY-like chemotaxis protein
MVSQALERGTDGSHKQRVLVADDDREQADGLAYLLTSWGYEVRAVYDGLSALQAAEKDPPDIALIDLGLPGMDGYQVAIHLRRRPESKGLKLIAVTGFDWPNAAHRSQQYGFDAHLVKPLDPDRLRKLLTVPENAPVVEDVTQ